MTCNDSHGQDRAHSSFIPLFYLALFAFAVIGAANVVQWAIERLPSSIGAAHAAFVNWLTTPVMSPLGFVGAISMGMVVIVVLVYPMVGPRP